MTVVFVIVVPAMIAVMLAVPSVIVFYAAVIAIPVTCVKAFAVVARANPAGAGVWRPRPVAFMPSIAAADGIPVTADPDEVRSGLIGKHRDHSWGRWRADANTYGDLSARGVRAGKQKCDSTPTFSKVFIL